MKFTDWLTLPLLLVILFWLFRSSRSKLQFRKLRTIAAISLLIYLIATSPITAALALQGLVYFLPADSGETVDAIVIVGRGPALRESRIEVAAQLMQAHRAPLIFASGMNDAALIVDRLKAKADPTQKLAGESCSQSTQENAQYTAALLYPKDVRQILLITDPPHMLRSLFSFRSFGFTVIPHTSPLPPYLTGAALSHSVWREYVGLVGYKFRGHFQKRPESELKHPPTEVLKKFSDWDCITIS
ncbi:MAG: YdcF family protein [Coleofasciculus sp. S288]|nr:YdcF family protein [Coleofasciculus sp. S288]